MSATRARLALELEGFRQRSILRSGKQQVLDELDGQIGILQGGSTDLGPKLDLMGNGSALGLSRVPSGFVQFIIDANGYAHGFTTKVFI